MPFPHLLLFCFLYLDAFSLSTFPLNTGVPSSMPLALFSHYTFFLWILIHILFLNYPHRLYANESPKALTSFLKTHLLKYLLNICTLSSRSILNSICKAPLCYKLKNLILFLYSPIADECYHLINLQARVRGT